MKVTDGFHSRVYLDRPEYADYPAREKFQAILGIIGTRLKEYPKAICSYNEYKAAKKGKTKADENQLTLFEE